MGTHRSRHNKGRKPLYKEHGSESFRNLDFNEKSGRKKIIPVLPTPRRTERAVELTETVARYLAARKTREAAPVKSPKLPALPAVQLRSLLPFDRDLVGTADHDIALKLYMERRASLNQLMSARMWQHYLEEYTVQPCVSIDPSSPLRNQMWQRDGDLDEAQHRAMIVRKIITKALGVARVRFLDAILQPDIGRTDAVKMFGVSWQKLEYELLYCLDALSIYFGRESGFPGDGMDVIRDAHAQREDYRLRWMKEIAGADYSPFENARTIRQEDAEGHRDAMSSLR